MKSKFLSICMAVAVASLMFACEEPNNEVENNGGGTGVTTLVENPEPIMRPDILTPINYTPDTVEGGEDGVTINVTQKLTDNIKFTVSPGANIQSYRLDVYPLCRLYNSLYENMKNMGKNMSKQLSEAEVEDMIRTFIFDDQGAGAYTFSLDNMEDFLRHEFDWMNTSYAQAKVVPDCEYVIAAVGCFDKDGYEQGDLSLCYVRTPYHTLQGEPRVEIEALTNYTAMQLTYTPNSDCKYFYQWCSNQSDLEPFIETYGEKLYADFMRNAVYDPTAANDTAGCFFYRDFGLDASSEVPIMATAIGLDRNYTPAKEFQSEVFNLLARPKNSKAAEVYISVNEEYIGANVFWLDVEMGKNCKAAVMKVITKEQAELYQQYTEEEAAVWAKTIYDDGWGFSNQNYQYNLQTDQLLGSSCRVSEPWVNASSDTEYVIAYTARNQYAELAPVQYTMPFKTKTSVKDAPERSEENVNLELTSGDVQQVNIKFTYDFEKVAKIHFQYIEGFDRGGLYVPERTASREDFVNWLYEEGDNMGEVGEERVMINHWWSERRGVDEWTDILEPGTTYTIAYIAEDWNGVLGEVKFASTSTEVLAGGSNPTMSITGDFDENNKPFFTYTKGEEAMQMKTATVTDVELPSLKHLGNKNVLLYSEAVDAWESFVIANGITWSGDTHTDNASELSVAIGISIGGTPSSPIFGPMEHLIFADGEFRTLAHYYPDDVPAAVQGALKRARQSVVSDAMRSVGYVHSSQLPECESGKPMLSVEEFAKESNLVLVDYQKLSSHPKASGR